MRHDKQVSLTNHYDSSPTEHFLFAALSQTKINLLLMKICFVAEICFLIVSDINVLSKS